jgi:hypothetical protein
MLSPGAITPLKIIGQGSPYNMHIVIFLCNKFHKNPPQGLGGVAKKRLKRRTD